MSRLEQLKEFLKTEPDDVFTLYALALEYIKINEHQTAIDFLRRVIGQNNDYVAAYYQLGQLLEKQNANEAADIYKAGIVVANKIKNMHARSELLSAYNLLTDEY